MIEGLRVRMVVDDHLVLEGVMRPFLRKLFKKPMLTLCKASSLVNAIWGEGGST